MTARYEYLNMLRNKVGAEGVSHEELHAVSGMLETARRALKRKKESGKLGFFDAPSDRRSDRAMKAFLERLPDEVETMVVIGIGGSLLGAQALDKALTGLRKPSRLRAPLKLVFAGDATDPQAIADLLGGVDWKRTALNVISKSGDTIEPMSVFTLARERMTKVLGRAKAAARTLATTDAEKGTMRKIADREGYATVPVPGNVGGRYSVLTEVGTFPAMAAGIDVAGLRKGAVEEDARFWKAAPLKNPAMIYAALQYLLYRKGKTISVLMPYAQRLSLLGAWYRQLWAESLGKKLDRTSDGAHIGPTPIAAVGPADQHSQIQLYNEGPNDKSITFIEVDRFAKDERLPRPFPDIEGVAYFAGHSMTEIIHYERMATAEALAQNRRPNGTFFLEDLSAASVGAFMQTMMEATAVAGELFGVNAFDQPGVEAGKIGMYKLMGREGY